MSSIEDEIRKLKSEKSQQVSKLKVSSGLSKSNGVSVKDEKVNIKPEPIPCAEEDENKEEVVNEQKINNTEVNKIGNKEKSKKIDTSKEEPIIETVQESENGGKEMFELLSILADALKRCIMFISILIPVMVVTLKELIEPLVGKVEKREFNQKVLLIFIGIVVLVLGISVVNGEYDFMSAFPPIATIVIIYYIERS